MTILYKKVFETSTRDKLNITCAYDLIKYLVISANDYTSLSGREKKEMVIQTLEYIIRGPDGIMYTRDDMIPAYVYDSIILLINSGMISSTIDLVCEAVHVKTGLTIGSWLFKYLTFCCCYPKKKNPLIIHGQSA
jgi:hypothetical protein